MKILVIQTARFGDIFLTWPVLRALKRKYPDSSLHVLVRSRFKAAAEDCEVIDHLHLQDTVDLIGGLITSTETIERALERSSKFVDDLEAENFDEVINLSFSPSSSVLTSMVAGSKTRVRGYSRHSDGYLALPDDTSAYFYAQVGIGKENRFHLCEILAATADVILEDTDWIPSSRWNLDEKWLKWQSEYNELNSPYILIHLGASQQDKTFPPFKWVRVMREIQHRWPGCIFLVGSANERDLVEEIIAEGCDEKVINLVGKTEFADVVTLLTRAQLLVGADSAPMHLANFTGTQCLNLSYNSVNFWETGPRVLGSRIVFANTPFEMPSEQVADEALSMLGDLPSTSTCILRTGTQPIGYRWTRGYHESRSWEIIEAIYTGAHWPAHLSDVERKAVIQMMEAVLVGLLQIETMKNPERRATAQMILDRMDEAINSIGEIIPLLKPAVGWFVAEKIRVGPCPVEDLIGLYAKIYEGLHTILLHLHNPFNESSVEVQP